MPRIGEPGMGEVAALDRVAHHVGRDVECGIGRASGVASGM